MLTSHIKFSNMVINKHFKRQKISQQPIVVETYKPSANAPFTSIDEALCHAHYFRIESFNYKVGDCHFDTIHVLLHCHYTLRYLHNGCIDHFLNSFHNHFHIASSSYDTDLHPKLLVRLHNFHEKYISIKNEAFIHINQQQW